jgi:hypothetical protein
MRRSLLLVPVLLLSLAACGGEDKITPAAAPPSTSATESSAPAETSKAPEPKASPKPTKPTVTQMALGTPVSVTGKDGDVDVAGTVTTDAAVQLSKKALAQYRDAPKNTYVGVTVTYDCTAGPCDYNPYDWTLRGADGTEYDKSYGGFPPELKSGNLSTGTKAKGVLTFDLPAGSYLLEYRASLFGDDVASWVLPVA